MVFQTISLTRVDAEVLRRALNLWGIELNKMRSPWPSQAENVPCDILSNHFEDLARRLDQLAQDFRDDELTHAGVTSAEIPF